uniref:Uncharacterized protein n=1 Tax=Candidatus Kentrum sp. LPFa TaxID=2126335 RepID=A0A450XSM8_9GAMM|nr:MAG: hypothetical protein BECKLPF1236A_GA0070988_101702 [Candidatus Kentron sp. LPFa]VFK32272.1 MAG: hypothetical protein BECKLPF1236C_GA0070990_101622 [Candidatus Kentron sp. LPFa]
MFISAQLRKRVGLLYRFFISVNHASLVVRRSFAREHFQMVGLDVSRRLLFIELVVIGGIWYANIKPAEAL